MRKRRYLVFIAVSMVIIMSLSFMIVRSYGNGDNTDTYVEPSTTEVLTIEPKPLVITTENAEEVEEIIEETTEPNFHSRMSCDWDSEDSYLLAKIAMAEAEGEDVEGKAYVMMVVLNRMLDDEFQDTIEDVIYQKIPNSNYHQFSPLDDGRFDRVEPNEECWQALEMIMVDKWDKSQGALYFESCPDEDNWHSRNLEYLFTHGCHRFYK